jgi:hypothetical protein
MHKTVSAVCHADHQHSCSSSNLSPTPNLQISAFNTNHFPDQTPSMFQTAPSEDIMIN